MFSSLALLKIKFSDFDNVEDFKRAVNALPLLNSVTYIDKALRVAYNRLFKKANGMRTNVPRVLILLTDGKQTHGRGVVPLPKAVKPFHDAGIKVIVVGIGPSVNRRQLRSMVKSGKDLYLAKNFDQLKSESFVKKITGATCRLSGKPNNSYLLSFCPVSDLFGKRNPILYKANSIAQRWRLECGRVVVEG